MFEVLTFVYENYDASDICRQPARLARTLHGEGFEADAVHAALGWLQGMEGAAHPAPLQPWLLLPDARSVRIYPPHELQRLGANAVGFLSFLDSAGVLPAHMRELVIDRALAAPSGPVALDDLKLIILMVYWRFGHAPDALVLDELCGSGEVRTVH